MLQTHSADNNCLIRDTLSQSDKDKIDWIPNKLLHCLFQKIREDKLVPLSPSISFSLLSIFPSISLPLSLTPFYLPLPLSSSLSHSFLSSPPSLFILFISVSLSLFLSLTLSSSLFHFFSNSILVTRGLLSCIIPVSLKPDAKVTRLLHIYNSFDENALR